MSDPQYTLCDLCGAIVSKNRLPTHRDGRECRAYQLQIQLAKEGWECLRLDLPFYTHWHIWRAVPASHRRLARTRVRFEADAKHRTNPLIEDERWVLSPLFPLTIRQLWSYAFEATPDAPLTHTTADLDLLLFLLEYGREYPDEVRATVALWQLQAQAQRDN